MSINVTVTGNPVNIKKGKMVCYDRNNCKKEFEKRRLMRLEQVRQQSKEIAEDVRKKVRNEKTKQLSQLEREGEEKQKKWQARKLLELQNQYKEAVRDIGLGHKEATLLPSDSDVLCDEKEKNYRVTKGRGHKAAQRLQIERNEANYKQALPRQQRKLAREIENSRAALVSNLCKNGQSPFKNKKRRRRPADYAGGYCCDESDLESDIPKLAIQESDECTECSSQCALSMDDETETSDQLVDIVQKHNQHGVKSNVCYKRGAHQNKHLRDTHIFLTQDDRDDIEHNRSEIRSKQLRDDNIFLIGGAANGARMNTREIRNSEQAKNFRMKQRAPAVAENVNKSQKNSYAVRNSRNLGDKQIFLGKEDVDNFQMKEQESVLIENLQDDHIFLTGENEAKGQKKTSAARNSRPLGDKQIFLGRDDINNFQMKEQEQVNTENLQDDQIFLTAENGNTVQKKSSAAKKPRQLGDKQIFLGRDDINNFQMEEREVENLQDDHIFLTKENGNTVQKQSSASKKSRPLGDKQIFLGREDVNNFQMKDRGQVNIENLQDDQIFLPGENENGVPKKSSAAKKSRQVGDKQIFLGREDVDNFQMKERESVLIENLQDDHIFLSGQNENGVPKKSSASKKSRQLGDKQIFLGREDVNDFQMKEREQVNIARLQDDHIFLSGENANGGQRRSSAAQNSRHLGDKQIFLGREDVNNFQMKEQESVTADQLKDDHIFLTEEDMNNVQQQAKRTVQSQVISKSQQTSSTLMPIIPSENKSVQAFPRESFRTRLDIPVDTRISDRIRSRATIPEGTDLCDTFNDRVCTCNDFTRPPCYCGDRAAKPAPVDVRRSLDAPGATRRRGDLRSVSGQRQGSRQQQHGRDDPGGGMQTRNDIPTKPKVVLKPKDNMYTSAQTQSKINYYDHDNRFSKEYIKDGSCVERISEEDLRVSPGADSDVQYYDKVFKRDKDAQMRGQKALEKERIQREYKELLKKLPALQRQERICEINNDKPEYHMSEERLLEKERKRQNKMDNAFEKAFPQRKPAVVTIPRKNHQAPDVNLTPFKTGQTADGSPVLNLGEWDVEPKHQRGSDVEPTQTDKERREQLKHLLESLQNQKKLLLQEIQSLPNDSSLHELVAKLSNGDFENKNTKESPSRAKEKVVPKRAPAPREARRRKEDTIQEEDMEDVDEESSETENTRVGTPRKVRPREKSKRRRSPVKPESLNASVDSNIDSHRSLSKEERYKKRHEKCFTSETAVSPTSPSPRKKPKIKKYKKRAIILQNCGTQTAPLETKKPEKVTSKSEKVITDRNVTKSDSEGAGQSKDMPQVDVPVSESQREGQFQPEKACSKSHVPCDCLYLHKGDYPEDFCQIVIKIKDDKKPEITVNPPERNKNVQIITDDLSTEQDTVKDFSKENKRTKTTSSEKAQKKDDRKNKSGQKEEKSSYKPPQPPEELFKGTLSNENNAKLKPVTEPKAKSWRDELSKNSSGETTTTSYYSPPDFAKIRAELAQTDAGGTAPDPALPHARHNYDMLLKRKPQQQNIDASSCDGSRSHTTPESQRAPKVLDPKLVTYIKKLITMSREHIHDLGVSTVSDVSTPSQSVIEMESNKPLNQLQNIMKYFNLSSADLRHHLSVSSNGSSAQYKTRENLTLSSSDGSQIYTQNLSSRNYTSSPKKTSRDDSCGQSLPHKTSDSSMNRNLKKYAEIAETCSQRISNLTAMIQQVREEKMKMLQSPPGSDQDQSTKYMNLPTSQTSKQDERDAKKSDSSGETDEELPKNVLKIDYDLAEKLKKMTPEELKRYEQNMYDQVDKTDEKSNVSMSDSDRELFARLQNLLQKSGKVVRDARNEDKKSPLKDKTVGFTLDDPPGIAKQSVDTSDVPFVPLLLDIPKLPKLTSTPLQPEVIDTNHRRPPTSKGLAIAKRFNGEMAAVVPHELSTIAEADSQLSTKIDQSPSQKSNVNTPHKRVHISEEASKENVAASLDKSTKSSSKSSSVEKSVEIDDKKNSVSSKLSESDQSLINMLNEMNKSVRDSSKSDTPKLSSTSSDDKSDLETVEKMLRSIGMDWAVTTLRKTKEALALSSSSSSVDLNIKASRTKSKSSKSSDISLREFLAQQMVAKISSSTLKSNTSTPTSNLLGESQEMSAIHFSMEKQRTSTPIQSSSKSLDKSKSPQKIFSGESEISAVKNNSKEVKNDVTFYSLSETPSSDS